MNKLLLILLSTLAGIERTFFLFTPILLGTIWISTFGLENIGSYIVFIMGLLATIFRAIKIGWLR